MHYTRQNISGTCLRVPTLRALWMFVLAFFVLTLPHRVLAIYMYDGADYYLDNTLLEFQTPRLVIYDGSQMVQVVNMERAQELDHNYYRASINLHLEEETHLQWCGYMAFVDCELDEGFYETYTKFDDFLEEYSIARYTALDSSTPPMLTDNVFRPYSGESGTLGRWLPMDLSQFSPSGHLPIVYVTTENRQVISSKEQYINAGIYIEPHGDLSLELGSAQSPVSLQIRGRGNSTWKSYKKPFKLKFSSKVDLMGTGKSKHYALIAPFDGGEDYLKTQLGTSMSNLLQFAWTPSYVPVELVVNDEYLGLYILIETVRVEKNRVNVYDQEDNYDPDDVTGGWLIEMDNYDDPNQIILFDGDGRRLRYTFHSPEEPNEVQLRWVTEQLKDMLQVMWTQDKDDNTLWEEYLDLDDAVRYYLLGELLEDTDRYNGSIYLHRHKGQGEKWHYGPIWDLNSLCYYQGGTMSISEQYPFKPQLLWELLKYPQFITRASQMWEQFQANKLQELYAQLKDAYELIKHAVPSSQARYPAWAEHEGSLTLGYLRLVRMLDRRSRWLSEWLNTLSAVENITSDESTDPSLTIGDYSLVAPLDVYSITGAYVGSYNSLTSLPQGYYIIRDANGHAIKKQIRQ